MAAATSFSVTLTAVTGPGKSVTAAVISDVSTIQLNAAAGVGKLFLNNPPNSTPRTIEFQYSSIATVTVTPSTGAVVIST